MVRLNKKYLKKYFAPENFFNREFSWVEFNRRVLEEALDPDLPLLEKIKFISIFHSNLDEFYMIRVSGLNEQLRANVYEPTIDGMTPMQQIIQIENEIEPMLNQINDLWYNHIVPDLKNYKVHVSRYFELNDKEKKVLDEYFDTEIFPVLTPLAFDPGRPFPYISNLSISFAIQIKKQDGEFHFARVKIPNILPRFIRLDKISKVDCVSGCTKFVWVDNIIRHNLHKLFNGVEIINAHRFRITRNTDMEIQEDEADDLLEVIEENIRQRKFGSVVRLEVEESMPEFMIDTLAENLQVMKHNVHIAHGPLGMSNVMELYNHPDHDLKDIPYHPITPHYFEEEESLFQLIKKRDVLLHHPYESFNPVIDFIKEAVQDPDVLAIKQTLYRVGQNSPIVKYLIEAVERKKQVAVLVELKARFDEENNIYWARKLEEAGAHVVYGLVGLKTHAKMTLVVRKEADGVKRYVHLGTGNYNASTAKIYTDLGLFTANPEICADVSEVFNLLTGYAEQTKFRKLMVAPHGMRERFLHLIEREITNAQSGGEGKLIFKMNSLVDPTIIAALYYASNQGVQIDLIIRGICCLVPQKPGLSENIRVVSIVGRFLEHSRLYYFHNNGDFEIYAGSADLMPRNLDRRVETIFPIEDEKLKEYCKKVILDNSVKDNQKSRVLLPSGKYSFNKRVFTEKKIDLQDWLMKHTSK